MGNDTFVKAYRNVHDSFVAKIALFDTLLQKLSEHLNGSDARYDADSDWFHIGNRGTGIFTSDYKKMVGAAEAFSDISDILLGKSSGSTPQEPREPSGSTTVRLGDVDGDGDVTSGDARLALRASVKLEKQIVKGAAAFTAADVNKDGVVGSDDARKILRVSVKLETFA